MAERGLSDLRPGFAVSPVMDRAFALGWPEMYAIGDGGGIPIEAGGRRWVWTREDAEARVPEHDPLKVAREALIRGVATDVLLLECIAGSEALAGAMITALEEISANEWRRADRAAIPVFDLLPIVLLRVEENAARALVERFESIMAKRADVSSPLGGLTLAFSVTEAQTERFAQYDRKNAARLAFLGARGVFDRWYLVGNPLAQSYFLATAGQIAGAEVERAILEGAHVSLVPDEVAAWLAARKLTLPPTPASPKPADLDSVVCGEADEFGFVFLPEAAAAQLTGEDDHAQLTANVDPTSLEPTAVEAHGAKGFLFCRTYDVARCEIEDGALVAYGSDEVEMRDAFANAADRRWVALTTIEGPLVGLPASSTLADATPFPLPLAPGKYAVATAVQSNADGEELVPLLWLRKI